MPAPYGIIRSGDDFRVTWDEQKDKVTIEKGSEALRLSYDEFRRITELRDYLFPRTIQY